MRLIHTDIKAFVESITSVNTYPIFFPENETLPAIVYRLEDATRDADSDLDKSNVIDHTFVLFVASKSFSQTLSLTQSLINSIESRGFIQGNTDVLIAHVLSVSDDYDQEKSLYMQAIQVHLKVAETSNPN